MPRFRLSRQAQRTLLASFVLPLAAGCTAGFYKKRADKETFGILQGKSGKVPNSGSDLFSITPPAPVDLAKLEENLKTEATAITSAKRSSSTWARWTSPSPASSSPPSSQGPGPAR